MKILKLIIICFLALSFTFLKGQTVGNASYYSNKLHGSKTTSGHRYHKDSLTCAHKTFPLGSYVKVRHLRNNKEVVVKVTDRGPHVKGRIIDLSYAAAKKIGLVEHGVGKVEITHLGKDYKYAASNKNDSIKPDSLKVQANIKSKTDSVH